MTPTPSSRSQRVSDFLQSGRKIYALSQNRPRKERAQFRDCGVLANVVISIYFALTDLRGDSAIP